MIAQEALEVWAKGREFPYLSDFDKEKYFQFLKDGYKSTDDDERGWSIEAMYRLLWDFNEKQRDEAIRILIASVLDHNVKCSERAVKGLQFALEFMNAEHAFLTLVKLRSVTEVEPEIIQVVSIEISYSLYVLFSGDRKMLAEALKTLLHLEHVNPEWLKRTVPSVSRLHSLSSTMSQGVILSQIGIIRNGYNTLRQMDDFDSSSISRIHIWPDYLKDLKGIETLKHIVIVCYLDEQTPLKDNASIRQKQKHNPEFGQFATSHPLRRNPICYKTGAFAGIEDNILLVQGIRVLDMTPVVDIRAANIHDMNGLSLCATK
ncbi:MAG: hypothetical protein BGO76_00300 [Caedibacter sp. 38-128]|nr:SAM-dependent methyltransferase [Holosporales bacterium]OJX05025.1 MAG: hypothetical protein BGO76_00300 [Caedibacter sp. 38-128]